jgi:hypothetical protein
MMIYFSIKKSILFSSNYRRICNSIEQAQDDLHQQADLTTSHDCPPLNLREFGLTFCYSACFFSRDDVFCSSQLSSFYVDDPFLLQYKLYKFFLLSFRFLSPCAILVKKKKYNFVFSPLKLK